VTGPVRALSVDLAERAYPVLVGPGARHEIARFLRRRQVGRDRHPGGDQDAGWVDGLNPGLPPRPSSSRREDAKTLATVEDLARRFARAGLSRPTSSSPSAGDRDRCRGLRRGHLPPRTPYVNVAPRCSARSTPPSVAKRGEPPEGRTRRRVLAAHRRAVRHRDALVAAPARMACAAAKSPSTPSSATAPRRTSDRGAGGALRGDQGGGRGRGRARGWPTHGAQLRPHLAHALEAAALADHTSGTCATGSRGHRIVFAALLAQRLGRIDERRVDDHRKVIGSFDLPTDLPSGADATELVTFMSRDKKAQQDLTFVLDGPRGVEPVHGVAAADVVATLAAMGVRT